jgi:iron-sulfur cluster repair protein YtfE (RIC family)
MPPTDTPPPCASKPLHACIDELTRTTHETLRLELPLVARLAEDELARHCREHPELAMLHVTVCVVRDAAMAHIEREEALLFPSIRLAEDGRLDAALNLHELIPELIREHRQVRDLLAKVRVMSTALLTAGSSPLLRTLYTALARNARILTDSFTFEERTLFPRALALQPSSPQFPPEC